MKKPAVGGPKSKRSLQSAVRSRKHNAKPASRVRPNVESAEFSAGPRTPDLGPRILIVGYGNPLRRDDALGWHASRLLAEALVGKDVEVITCHQLTPELAEPLSRCQRAVFIDADAEGKPGEI